MRSFFIDIGSTNIKYAVFDNGMYLLNSRMPFPPPKSKEPYTVDRTLVDEAIIKLMDLATEHSCGEIYICTQMHGFLIKNSQGSMSDYFSWRSGGGDTESEALSEIDFASRGTKLKGNLPLARLYSERDKLQGCEFFTLGSYVSFLLTGNNITHKTDACASGFYSADGKKCDTKAIGGLLLPRVFSAVESCGKYRGMEVFSPVGDHAAAILGCDVDEDTYVLNIGTTSQIAFLGELEDIGAWEPRPYFDGAKKLFTLGNQFYGMLDDTKAYCEAVIDVLEKLPPKKRVMLCGGGAKKIEKELAVLLEGISMTCITNKENVTLCGLERLANRVGISLGTMLCEAQFSNIPIIMKNAGLDFFILDNEHGAFDFDFVCRILTVCKLCGFNSIIRLPDNRRELITKYADAGAGGFLLPTTNTAEDIKRVVEYAKYAPIGKRGVSTMRLHTLYNPPDLTTYSQLANESLRIYAQIESRQGVENVESILATEGVEGVFVGPNDLSADLGTSPDGEEILECIEKVAKASKAAGKRWGIITTNAKLIKFARELSTDMISYGSELNMLDNGCKGIVQAFRE